MNQQENPVFPWEPRVLLLSDTGHMPGTSGSSPVVTTEHGINALGVLSRISTGQHFQLLRFNRRDLLSFAIVRGKHVESKVRRRALQEDHAAVVAWIAGKIVVFEVRERLLVRLPIRSSDGQQTAEPCLRVPSSRQTQRSPIRFHPSPARPRTSRCHHRRQYPASVPCGSMPGTGLA